MNFKKSALSTVLFSVTTAVNAIELTDYTAPNTSFEDAYVDFNANMNSGNQDQLSYSSLINANLNKSDSTERKVLGYALSGNANMSRGPNSNDESESDFGLSLGINTDVYFSETREKLFYFGSVSYAHQDSATDDNIGLTVGLGYGRVWNATELAKTLRIQESLTQAGVISKAMSDDQLLALAAIIGRENEFSVKYGASEYKGEWYKAMESIMVESGVLANDELGALGTIKLDNVLFNEAISARRHGWLVRGGAGFQSSDFSGITDNDPKLLFQLEYAKPYGLTGQLLNTASYEPIFGNNTVQKISNRLSYTYEISDRIDWLNSWELAFQQADDANDSRFVTNTLASTAAYHLTNKMDLGLTVTAVKTSDRPNQNRSNEDVALSAVLGLRYRVK